VFGKRKDEVLKQLKATLAVNIAAAVKLMIGVPTNAT